MPEQSGVGISHGEFCIVFFWLGLTDFLVFGDSTSVIDWTNDKGSFNSPNLDAWKCRIQCLIKEFHSITISHIYRIQDPKWRCRLSIQGRFSAETARIFSSFLTLAHYRGLDILWSKRWLKTPSIKLCFLFVSASSVTFIGLSLLRLYWIWRSIIGIESISLSSLHLPLCFVDKCVPQLLIWYDGYYWHVWITRFEFGSFTAHMCIPCILCISLVCLGWDGEQT